MNLSVRRLVEKVDNFGVHYATSARQHPGFVRHSMVVSQVARGHALWIVAGFARAGALRQPRLGAESAFLFVAEFALTNFIVKPVLKRKRPLPGLHPPAGSWTPRTSSFPSGHTSAATLAVLVYQTPRWLALPVAAVAVDVAQSRIVLRHHHLTDVVGGVVWGATFYFICRRLRFPLSTFKG